MLATADQPSAKLRQDAERPGTIPFPIPFSFVDHWESAIMVLSRIWQSRAAFVGLSLFGLAALAPTAMAQTVVYDGLNAGTVPTFTGSVPRTFMGQGFQVSDPGTPVMISSIRVNLVAGGAVNYAASRLNVQIWDTYDPAATGTALVFSNPLTAKVYDTGAINTTAATAFTFTLAVVPPLPLTGLTNHGITFNWQSDAAGTGTFINDTLLTTALRTGTGGTMPPPALQAGAANLNPGGGYYRNASGLTTANFQANDSRTIANVGGLMFELTAAPPTPVTLQQFSIE